MASKTKAQLERELEKKTALLQRFVNLKEEGQVTLCCNDAECLNRDIRTSLRMGGVTDQDILITLRLPAGYSVPAGKDAGNDCQATDNLNIVIKDHNDKLIDWAWETTDFAD